MRLPLLLLPLIASFALVAMTPGPSRATANAVVQMNDDSFDPPSIRIEPGDTVTWVNRGRNPHNVVANDGAFRSKILQTGDTDRKSVV